MYDEYIFLTLISAVVSGIAIFTVLNLKKRVNALERRLLDLTTSTLPIAPTKSKPDKNPAASKSLDTTTKITPKPTSDVLVRDVPPEPRNLGPNFLDRITQNIKENWLIWLAGVSLAFGGAFFVQYGLERGLLGPEARVMCALGFGAILIAAAEWMRRKSGGQVGLFTVPVAFASAGIASLFAGTVSAHVLYDLTSPLIGFLSMAAVAWFAMAGGLIYGPMLAVIGILGAYASPFLVAGNGASPMLYAYFALVFAAALAVERWQRWIWLSTLGAVGSLIWGILLFFALRSQVYLGPYMLVLIALALCIPAFGVPPKWSNATWVNPSSIRHISTHYPTVFALAVTIAATCIITWAGLFTILQWQVGLLIILALCAISILLCSKAENLDQIAAITGASIVAFLLFVAEVPNIRTTVSVGLETDIALRNHLDFGLTGLLGTLALFLVGSIWRSTRSTRPVYWNLLAASIPTAAFGAFYYNWAQTHFLPPSGWTAAAAALAAYQGALAAIQHRRGDTGHTSADVLASGAAVSLGIALSIGLSDGALTIAVTALAVALVLIAHRFSYRWLLLMSVIATAWAFGRLVFLPGLVFVADNTILGHLAIYGLSLGILAFGWRFATRETLSAQVAQFETAGIAIAVVGIIGLLALLEPTLLNALHAGLGVFASLLLISALVQFKRAALIAEFTRLRRGIGIAYLSLGVLILLLNVTIATPLDRSIFGGDKITGVFPIDSLMLGYALPAAFLALHYFWPKAPSLFPTKIALPIAAFLGALTVTFEIRRFWHGRDISNNTILREELYSYTIALLILVVTLIVLSILRNHRTLRTIGLAMSGVTATKVFMWDMSGLQGLGRATAFIGLGLTLAGIGWLHQRFSFSEDTAEPEPASDPERDPKTEKGAQ